jgi:hypothetical protein
VDRCIAGIEAWLDAGIEAAMNRVNVRGPKRIDGDEQQQA